MTIKHLVGNRAVIFIIGVALNVAAQASDAVPLTFIDGIPFVTVTVGATSSRMMIDTGGSLGISIPEITADKSGSVRLLNETTKFRDLKGDVYEVKNLVAEKVGVGNTNLGSVKGRIHVRWGGESPDAELSKARQAGAIDLVAFGNRPVMFDYRDSKLAIYAPGEPRPSGQQSWQALRLEFGKEGPNVSLVVHGKPLKFVLDTGATVNLVNPGSLIAAGAQPQCAETGHDKNCDPRELGTVLDENGRAVGKLSAERIDLNGAPFDGILGAPFFQSYSVLFDYSSDLLLISPFDANGTTL